MLTLVSNTSTTAAILNASSELQGEELLLEYLLWQTKFDENPAEIFEDSIELFLAQQSTKPLALV